MALFSAQLLTEFRKPLKWEFQTFVSVVCIRGRITASIVFVEVHDNTFEEIDFNLLPQNPGDLLFFS